MDFGGLDDILDDDIGYVPTAIKREEKPRGRPATISRQNSTQSIGSIKDTKEQQPKGLFGNSKQNDSFWGIAKQSPKNNSLGFDQEIVRQPSRRNTLFGAHKQTASIAQNSGNSHSPISFEQFFRNQNTPNQQTFSKPPLPDSRPPLPERKLQKNSSFSQLSSPQNIIEDELNNSSVASRRGRPPLSKRNQNTSNENEIQQNKSQNFGSSKGFASFGDMPTLPTSSSQVAKAHSLQIKHQQSVPVVMPQQAHSFNTSAQAPQLNQTLINQSIQEFKKVFQSQLQYQKHAFETLIKQQRQSHQQQLQKSKEFQEQQLKKKLEIKDFELQKSKEFYQLQLKIYSQRQIEIKEYSLIARKLQGNIQTIQKMERNLKDSEFRNKKDKEEEIKKTIERKQSELKKKQTQIKQEMRQLQQQKQQFRNQKLSLTQSIGTQKTRLYELEVDLRKRQGQLQTKYKKLEARLMQEYQKKSKELEKERQELRMQSLQLKQQRNIIQVQKLQVINSRKLWDTQKKAYLQQLHDQKTKVLQKEIEIASRTGQLEIKEQEVQMHQNDYVNKLKLIELEKKKLEIQKNNTKGQLYLGATSGTLKTHGLLGTCFVNRTNQTALQKQFYSNEQYENEPFEQQSNYKKSITQMRNQFLKSLPKF